MEKSCHSSAANSTPAASAAVVVDTATSTTTSSSLAPSTTHIHNSLKALNKSSYKISKPPLRNPNPNPNPIRSASPPPPKNPNTSSQPPSGNQQQQQQQPQPPVYNIDKNNFRDAVQRLTGAPSNRHQSPPKPQPKPAGIPPSTTRLHRIRPPPLAQLAHRPPPPSAGDGWLRPALSPLPPFPTVSAAAESPITAYMRRLHGGSTLLSPVLPQSPLGFGCLPSQFPTSPGLELPSPKWRDV